MTDTPPIRRASSSDIRSGKALAESLEHFRGELLAAEGRLANLHSEVQRANGDIVDLQLQIFRLGEDIEKIQRLHTESMRPEPSAPDSEQPHKTLIPLEG